jgi:hypothetical protein
MQKIQNDPKRALSVFTTEILTRALEVVMDRLGRSLILLESYE